MNILDLDYWVIFNKTVKFFQYIKETATKAYKATANALSLFQTLLTVQLGSSLARTLPLAIQVVSELYDDEELTSSQKRKKAAKQLGDILKQEGVVVAVSVLNLAIELAVNKLNSLKK